MKNFSLLLLFPLLTYAMDPTPRPTEGSLEELQNLSPLEDVDLEKGKDLHNLLHEKAPQGTRLRKYVQRELQPPDEEASNNLHRTLSSADLNELVPALLEAGNKLNDRGDQYKKKKNQYAWAIKIGSGIGACLATALTIIVPAAIAWAHFHTKADCDNE